MNIYIKILITCVVWGFIAGTLKQTYGICIPRIFDVLVGIGSALFFNSQKKRS